MSHRGQINEHHAVSWGEALRGSIERSSFLLLAIVRHTPSEAFMPGVKSNWELTWELNDVMRVEGTMDILSFNEGPFSVDVFVYRLIQLSLER